MKSIFNECVERIQHSKQRYRRYVAVLLVLSLCTTLGVNWGLHQNGIAQTTDYQCGLAEHQHTADCYSTELSCGSEEHAHTSDCYDADGNLTCDKTEHTHTDSCYKKETVCGLEEHTHTIECMIDENADVESAADWESTIPTLTGVWADDLVAVAQSQIGYEESTRNFKLADDGETKMGYTRYGAWYENQYGAWSAMFVDFCLKYADITGVPTNSGCNAFMVDVKSADMFKSADSYQPKAGDIVFLDKDSDGTADSMGIVQSVSGTKLSAIEGDSNDRVETNDYTTDEVLGYAELPENPANGKTDNNTDADEAESDDAKADDTAADDSAAVDEPTQDDSTADDTTADNASADEDNTATADEGPVVSDDEIIGETHTDSSSEQTSLGKKLANAVSALFSSNSGISLASNDVNDTGVDMSQYITAVSFKKKNGVIWEESKEFTTADQVRASINFENVYTSTIKNNGNTIYIDLPAYIDCSSFTGTYDTYDGSTHSGKYTYQKNADGTYRIVLVLDDDYVNNAGDTIGGSLQFNFQWTKEAVDDSGSKRVEIGEWSGDVTIKEDTSGKKDEGTANYKIDKTAGSISYSEDKKTAYIDYTITLTVKDKMESPITMKDTLTGEGFTYDTSYGVKATDADGKTINANYGTTSGEEASTQIQLWTGNPGTYTLKYRVKTLPDIDISDPNSSFAGSVGNKIIVPEGDQNPAHSETWTNTTTGKINKQGQLVSGANATYIDYTVYLNAGNIIKNLKKGATFTDTLPSTLELVGDVTVEQYDVENNKVSSTKATVDGQNISYTTPAGQYYYIITYRTKVTASEIPLGGLTIKNDGKSTGGIEGSSSAEITVPNHVLHKKFTSQQIEQINGNWVNTIKWSSTVNVKGSLDGYVYEDWGELKYHQTDGWFAPLSMSDDQRSAIVVKDSDGNVVDSSKYTVTESSHYEEYNKDKDGNYINNGLFKITFSKDVTGPVTIEYETTADLSKFNVNEWLSFVNWGSISKDGHTDKDSAQSDRIMYTHGNPDIVAKYGSDSSLFGQDGGKIELKPGQTSIPWTIQVNKGRSLTTDLTITDTIAENLTFLPNTLEIKTYSKDLLKAGVEWSYDENTRQLKITIPKDVYQVTGQSYPSDIIFISYSTKLPDSFFSGADTNQKFTNTASVETDGSITDSTFTQDVTRQVVGKSGSYDKTTKMLSYNVVINPDGSKLNSGNPLTVIDTLDAGQLKDYITLHSLEVFTALKTTDSSGSVKVEPGKFVKELTAASGDAKSEFTYQWDDSNKSFTTYLPDGEAYVIVAKYYVGADVDSDVYMKNNVKIEGNNDWKTEDSSTRVEKDTSGETHTQKITVVKRDTAQYSKLLPGASFELDKYENSAWAEVSSVVTGDDGTGTIKDISYNTLYKLGETEAPDGYVVDEGPVYFIVVRESNEDKVATYLPDSISDDDEYSKDAVKVYTVKDNTSTETYYANIEIDRYNSVDKDKTEPGQLRVTKEWIGSDGEVMTDASSMKDVTVTLTKHVAKTGYKFVVGSDATYNTVIANNINDGGYIYISGWGIEEKWNNALSGTGYTLVKTDETDSTNSAPIYKIGPITSDVTILNNSLYQYWGSFVRTEGGTAPEGTTDTVIGTVTLNNANDWTYLWSNLDRSDGVTYTLTEQTVEGYKTTYTLNGSDLTEGTPFTPSTSGDKIVVTNKADQVYKLPESGGIGVTPYTAGGIAVMGTALLCGYSLRRRRERRGK